MRAAALVTLSAVLLAAPAAAAPEAHLLRIDARRAPVLEALIDLGQPRAIADVTRACATLTGAAYLDCLGDALEKPGALSTSFAFPEKNAVFTVAVGGVDTPLAFESAVRWGDSTGSAGVGTAWLIVIDASGAMARRFDDAKEIAQSFIDSMRPNDVIDVAFLHESGVLGDSHWLDDKARATAALATVPRVGPAQQAIRPLAGAVNMAVTDAYRGLFSGGARAPLHQAVVLVSSGDGVAPDTGADLLRRHFSRGRFKSTPKMPLPVVSVWLPSKSNPPPEAGEFMMGIANPEIGGFFTAVRPARKGRGPGIVSAVRARFDRMHLVRFRLTCSVIGPEQSFKLTFTNTTPPIAGDATFQDVPYNGPGPQPCKK